jgi:hypothetical protein
VPVRVCAYVLCDRSRWYRVAVHSWLLIGTVFLLHQHRQCRVLFLLFFRPKIATCRPLQNIASTLPSVFA